MGYFAANAVTGHNNRSKRAEIPIKIVGSAGANTIAITVMDPYVGVAECVNAVLDATSTPTNTLDTACDMTGLTKASTGQSMYLGFVVLDGAAELQGANIPLPGNAQNPAYGTAVVKGSAKFLRSAKLRITDGDTATPMVTMPAGMVLSASTIPGTSGNLGASGVTSNGNLQIKVRAPQLFSTTIHATVTPTVAPTLVATITLYGILELVWD